MLELMLENYFETSLLLQRFDWSIQMWCLESTNHRFGNGDWFPELGLSLIAYF